MPASSPLTRIRSRTRVAFPGLAGRCRGRPCLGLLKPLNTAMLVKHVGAELRSADELTN